MRRLVIAAALVAYAVPAGAQVPVQIQKPTGEFLNMEAASDWSQISTAAMMAAEVKGSAGVVDSWSCTGVASATAYARLYDQTGAPDPSADSANIVWRMLIQSTFGGFAESWPAGLDFETGIGIAVTEGVTDTDETALTANEIVCNVAYR